MAEEEEIVIEKTTKTIMGMITNAKVVIGGILTVISLITALWAVDDRYPKKDDLGTMEGRIVSEFRSESASTRMTLVEDMESRLDDMDYDISIHERNNEVVPEALRIKRNMLYRRIEALKNNETTNTSN